MAATPLPRPALRRTLTACAVTLACLAPALATAQASATTALSAQRSYAVPAQALGAALNALARQSGVAISVNADLVAGKSAPAVNGTMTLREALGRLLANSGLVATQEGAAVVLRAAPVAATTTPTERQLGEVRVTGERPSLGTFRLRETPGAVEPGIVIAETAERFAASDLEDLFAGQAEVQVGGGHSAAQKIYLRGIEDTLANVTIDGASQAGQTFHHTGRVQLEPELIKQVEVRPGTGDATAGPGALGGVLRFVTKDPDDLLAPGRTAGAMVKGGYFGNSDGVKLHTSVYGRFSETWSALAALTHQDLDDYKDGGGRRVDNTGAKQQLGFFKLVGKPVAGHTVRLSYDTFREEGERTQRPQWVTSGFNPAYPLESERGTWNLGYAFQPGNANVDLAFNVFRTDSEIEQNVIGRWGKYQGHVRSTGFDLRNTSFLGAHELTYGTDHRRDTITLGPDTDPTLDRESGSVTGVFLQDQFALTDRVRLGLGARYDRYKLTDSNGLPFSDSGVSPNASIRFAATRELTLLAGHARALRGAKIRDALKLDTIVNDPDLAPERARTSEAGFEYATGPWRLNGKAYTTTIKDAINDPIGRPVQNENVGTLRSRGVLLHGSRDWSRVRAGAALHVNRVTLDGQRLNAYDHNGLGASQGHTLTTNADWRVNGNLDVGWLGRFVRAIDRLNTPVGVVRKPGYAVHDIYAAWRPTGTDRFTLNVAIHNLFDKDYLDHGSNEDFQHITGYDGIVGSREPGRELRVNLTVRF